jgi:hypothetical protein
MKPRAIALLGAAVAVAVLLALAARRGSSVSGAAAGAPATETPRAPRPAPRFVALAAEPATAPDRPPLPGEPPGSASSPGGPRSAAAPTLSDVMREYRDALCACANKPCADALGPRWVSRMAAASHRPEESARAEAFKDEALACLRRLAEAAL